MLQQPAALGPFMWEPGMFALIAKRTSYHNIVFRIRTIANNGYHMINMVTLIDLLLAIVAFVLLPLQLILYILSGISTSNGSFTSTAVMSFYSTLFRMGSIISFLAFTDGIRVMLDVLSSSFSCQFCKLWISAYACLFSLILYRSPSCIIGFLANLANATQTTFHSMHCMEVFRGRRFPIFALCALLQRSIRGYTIHTVEAPFYRHAQGCIQHRLSTSFLVCSLYHKMAQEASL